MIMGSAAALGVALPGVEDNLLPEPTVKKSTNYIQMGGGGQGRQEVQSFEASTPCTGLQCGSQARWEAGTLRAGRRPHPTPHRGLCAGGGVLTGHSPSPQGAGSAGGGGGGSALSGTQDTCGP